MLRAERAAGAKAPRQEKSTCLGRTPEGSGGGAVGNEAGGPLSTQDLGGPGEGLGFGSRRSGKPLGCFYFVLFFNQESDLLQFEF